jgi:hypothetical protein
MLVDHHPSSVNRAKRVENESADAGKTGNPDEILMERSKATLYDFKRSRLNLGELRRHVRLGIVEAPDVH